MYFQQALIKVQFSNQTLVEVDREVLRNRPLRQHTKR
jgi:hypothetical protein